MINDRDRIYAQSTVCRRRIIRILFGRSLSIETALRRVEEAACAHPTRRSATATCNYPRAQCTRFARPSTSPHTGFYWPFIHFLCGTHLHTRAVCATPSEDSLSSRHFGMSLSLTLSFFKLHTATFKHTKRIHSYIQAPQIFVQNSCVYYYKVERTYNFKTESPHQK